MLFDTARSSVKAEAGEVDVNQEKKFVPRRRPGTKNFFDVPMDLKLKDFQSESGRYFMSVLPSDVAVHFKRAILETGIESADALKWLDYALSYNGSGKQVSPIAQRVNANPYDPWAFKYIYREEDALSPMDYGYVITTGAYGIYLRLQSLVERLPAIIYSERERFGLGPKDKYIIYNLGSAYSLDTIYAVAQSPELKDLVRIVCVDPDKESLNYGKKLAERLGVSACFEFIPKKMEYAGLEQAHLILFIGMFCVVQSKKIILTMKFIKKHVKVDGIIIFSTVQEKMLMGGPILDFIMWSYGWRMYFKADGEPGKIARLAGYAHNRWMDFEDKLGYNRMTVARKPKFSIFGAIGDIYKLAKVLMM